jgi:hypothetical protein
MLLRRRGRACSGLLYGPLGSVIDYLEAGFRPVADLLGLAPIFLSGSIRTSGTIIER